MESNAEGCQTWRRRNLRLQAIPHLGASNRKCSTANSEPEDGRCRKSEVLGDLEGRQHN